MKKSLLLIFALLFALSGCANETKETKARKKALTFISNFPLDTLDPHLSWNALRAGTVETLVNLQSDGTLQPNLATKWTSTNNGQTWTFTIRSNVTFHNGQPLTAEAVKASLLRSMATNEAMKLALQIKQIVATKQTLTLELSAPLYSLPSELTHPNTAIVDATSKTNDTAPIGTGPFAVKTFVANEKIHVRKFAAYWNGEPALNDVTMHYNEDENARTAALQSGEADIVYRPALTSLATLKADYKTLVERSTRTTMMLYNMKKPALQQKAVRQALNQLIDREQVVNTIMAGNAIVANGPFFTDAPFTPALTAPSLQIAAAKQLVTKPLQLKLVTYSFRPDLPLVAQVLKDNASKAGIDLQIEIVENIDERLLTNDWDVAIYSANTNPRNDASYYVNAALQTGGSINFTDFGDRQLQTLIATFNKTSDEQQRHALVKQIVQRVHDETYVSYIVHPSNYAATAKHVANFRLTPSEFYIITKDLTVK